MKIVSTLQKRLKGHEIVLKELDTPGEEPDLCKQGTRNTVSTFLRGKKTQGKLD